MSSKASFVTGYIRCDKCMAVVEDILGQDTKALVGFRIPAWQNCRDVTELPIMAGKLGVNDDDAELIFTYFEEDIIPQLGKAICCDLKVAVIGEEEEHMYYIVSGDGGDGWERGDPNYEGSA